MTNNDFLTKIDILKCTTRLKILHDAKTGKIDKKKMERNREAEQAFLSRE